MPLDDHFRSPWKDDNPWESFHSAWINTIVRHLNGFTLSPRYRAMPQVHLGAFVEADVATFDDTAGAGEGERDPGNALATAVWSPPAPAQTLVIDWPNQDVFEARVFDHVRGMRLVAAIELVSPRNKDRIESRRAFVSKCAAYLQEQVGLLVVDIATDRRASLHQELLEFLSPSQNGEELPPPCAVAYRNGKDNGAWHWDNWPARLQVGQPLPVMPLWLASNLGVPVDLEKSYEETAQVLRIRS
ncbi:MAG TPA: DUF4058 family protein [Pirellulales bacterium]|nr:DUF4058 family protein [Pirellulales bacterium]